MYHLDSNILIGFLRGHLMSAYELLMGSDASLFKVPAVVKAELLVGAEKSSRPDEERLRVESLLLPALHTMRRFVQILSRKGEPSAATIT